MYIWGKGRAAGRVRLFVGNRGSGRVGSTFRQVGSGPTKVTREQLCYRLLAGGSRRRPVFIKLPVIARPPGVPKNC